MRFSNFENTIASLETRGGYQVKFASATSDFSGDSNPVETAGGIWDDLIGENFRLLDNTLHTVDTARTRAGLLSNAAPRLHVELALPEAADARSYVVLILDNERGALVDWVLPSHEQSPQFRALETNAAAVYFDIPLVSVNTNTNQTRSADFLSQAAQWENQTQLTFGIFVIEDDEVMQRTQLMRSHFVGAMRAPAYDPNFRLQLNGLVNWLAHKADVYLKKNTDGQEVLQIIPASGVPRAASSTELSAINGKALLFCHGIFSSTVGAFEGLLGDPAFLAPLLTSYNKNVLAWDHYTLSKTTALNANNLLMEQLGALHNVTLDIVCHSRGGGVIRNFVENPNNIQTLAKQGVKINKVVFVAGACLGSQLAEAQNTDRLFRRLNMLFWFFKGAPAGFIKAILTIIKLLATIAQQMPGVESMNPVGTEITELNKFGKTAAAEYDYIRAHYDFHALPAKLLQEFLWDNGVFDGAANDLVVPYDGASPNPGYLPNQQSIMKDAYHYGDEKNPQSVVMHLNFFTQPETKSELNKLLP